MANRKNKAKPKQVLSLIAAITAIATGFLVFAPALGKGDTAYTGLNVAFGKEIANFFNIADGKMRFNILALLAYTLPIAAAAIMVVSKGKMGILLAAILTLASVMLFKTMPDYIKITYRIGNSQTAQAVDWQVKWGWIAAIALTTISTVINLFQLLLPFVKR